MRGFNRAIIAGNLTKDPELRYTANRKAYARFGVAVNYRSKDANGEYKDDTDFITVVAWGNTAERCGKYLKKGSPVLVEGRIKTSSYDAKDGSGKRYTTEIWIENMIMLGSGQQGQQGGNNNYGNTGFSGPGMGLGFDDLPTDGDYGSPIDEKGFNPAVGPEDANADIPF